MVWANVWDRMFMLWASCIICRSCLDKRTHGVTMSERRGGSSLLETVDGILLEKLRVIEVYNRRP